jgi:probable phosphoglycerate mutase
MPQSRTTRILAIRHGETAWNVDTRIQGQIDIPLNDNGRWQAQRLGQALAGERFDAIYASDLLRAHETATHLAEVVGLTVQLDRGLRERAFGCFEGMTQSEIEDKWPDDARRWRQREPDFGPEGGERLTEFYERCVGTAQRLAQEHPGETIVLVAHGGVLDCLYRAATRIDLQAPRTWKVANASINRLLHTSEGLNLVGWADTQHLEQAGLDESSDGIVRTLNVNDSRC